MFYNNVEKNRFAGCSIILLGTNFYKSLFANTNILIISDQHTDGRVSKVTLQNGAQYVYNKNIRIKISSIAVIQTVKHTKNIYNF